MREKSSGNLQIDPSVMTKLVDFVELFHAGLTASDAAQLALQAMKEGDQAAPTLARQAIIEFLAGLLDNKSISGSLRPWLDSMSAAIPRDASGKEALAGNRVCHEQHRELREMISEVKSVTDELKGYTKTFATFFISNDAVHRRYQSDHPTEKRRLAEYVAFAFFQQASLRCFVQASTTAIHLGQALAENHDFFPGSLFHTNSVIFPLTLLREDGKHAVYTFCASRYDEICGGYVPSDSDVETLDSLRALFRRRQDPLTLAFLMPLATTLKEGIYYRRGEMASFVRVLFDEAEHVVIMTIPSRIHDDNTSVAPECSCALKWSDVKKRVSLVIGRDDTLRIAGHFAEQFVQKGLEVHWFDHDTYSWQDSATISSQSTCHGQD